MLRNLTGIFEIFNLGINFSVHQLLYLSRIKGDLDVGKINTDAVAFNLYIM